MPKPPRRTPRRFTFADLPHPGDTIDFGEGEVGIVQLLSTEKTEIGTLSDASTMQATANVRVRYVAMQVEVERSPLDCPLSLVGVPPGILIATDRVDEVGLPLSVGEVVAAEGVAGQE